MASTAGIECIDVVEHFPFNVGNAIKYAWRAGLKGDAVEDMKKAAWYANREAERLEKMRAVQEPPVLFKCMCGHAEMYSRSSCSKCGAKTL